MNRPSILIVDDNASNVKLMEATLDSGLYVVKSALDAEEAIKILETFEPRLILMDIQLPGMDGLELTRLLKRDPARRHIVVIALTAYAMKGDEEKALAAGCDGYITKPIDTRSLSDLIDRHLDKGTPLKSASAAGRGNG
ncbi:MAG TPA: response regulator [Candidatus Binataceae bacterium]|nr:response regulator [Candidatus Binataceae bacterium]